MANKRNGTLYTGVTNNLAKRAHEHRTAIVHGFTKEHDCKILVWYQQFERYDDAVARENQIKRFERIWKLRLIERMNPDWRDLYSDLI